MKLNQAIEQAKKQHKATVKINNQKQVKRSVTVSGLCRFFNFIFEEYEYGTPPLITKKESNMISGFIKVLKNNHYSDSEIYEFVKGYIQNFEQIKKQNIYTIKGKIYTIGARPNIKDLLYCRDDLINKTKVQSIAQNNSSKTTDWSQEQLDVTEGW